MKTATKVVFPVKDKRKLREVFDDAKSVGCNTNPETDKEQYPNGHQPRSTTGSRYARSGLRRSAVSPSPTWTSCYAGVSSPNLSFAR